MSKEKIENLHREFSNEVRKFCKESDVTHMDLLILVVSAQNTLIKFLRTADVSPEEVAEVVLEKLPESDAKDLHIKACMEGLICAGLRS